MFSNPETRGIDPFNLIFPKMTKCTFNVYGPSGTLQNLDALCVLPINVLNEKIYFVTWFVFMGLGIFTVLHHLIASIIILGKVLQKSVTYNIFCKISVTRILTICISHLIFFTKNKWPSILVHNWNC